MGFCFLAGVGLRLSGLAVNNIVVLHASFVPVLYLIPLTAICVSLFLIARGTRPSRGNAMLDKISESAAELWASLMQRFSRRRGVAAPAGSRS
jgi:lipopolysaccharide export system permease protein